VKRLLRLVLVGAFAIAALAVAAAPALADNCSGDADCEQTGGYNGIIAVVGGFAAVAAAAAAAVAATPEGEETDRAIVQVSDARVDIAVDKPGRLTVTGWHVGKSGTPTRVGMPLSIEVPPACGVTVTPTVATGELVATVAVDEATLSPETEEVTLTARGSWKGKEASATVTVRIGGDYELRLYQRE
jgi:hypothetical protein